MILLAVPCRWWVPVSLFGNVSVSEMERSGAEAERNRCLSLRLGEPYFIYAPDVVFHHCLCPLSMYRLSVPISCLSKSIAWENGKKAAAAPTKKHHKFWTCQHIYHQTHCKTNGTNKSVYLCACLSACLFACLLFSSAFFLSRFSHFV